MGSWSATKDSFCIIEEQNKDYTNDLTNKVKRLKSLAFDIEMETKEQNRVLDGVSEDFDNADALMGNSSAYFHKMISSSKNGRRISLYTAAAVVACFLLSFLIWFR